MDKVEAMAALCPPLKIFVSEPCKKYLDSSLKSGVYEQTGPILLKVNGSSVHLSRILISCTPSRKFAKLYNFS